MDWNSVLFGIVCGLIGGFWGEITVKHFVKKKKDKEN